MQMSSDLITALRTTGTQVIEALPSILSATLLLLLGWLLARVARRVAIRVFRWMKVDVLAENLGIEGFLLQGGVEFTAVTLLAGAIY